MNTTQQPYTQKLIKKYQLIINLTIYSVFVYALVIGFMYIQKQLPTKDEPTFSIGYNFLALIIAGVIGYAFNTAGLRPKTLIGQIEFFNFINKNKKSNQLILSDEEIITISYYKNIMRGVLICEIVKIMGFIITLENFKNIYYSIILIATGLFFQVKLKSKDGELNKVIDQTIRLKQEILNKKENLN